MDHSLSASVFRMTALMKVKRDMTMMKAIWNGQTIAESDKTVEMDGFVYFPEETVKREFLRASSTTATDPTKG
jgi:uncharacterized protein (DUF427 family)